ncbi:MAG: 50S ribosomal protein L31 [Limnochordales bacterium]|nr:50S ribosomal protein L31 [Limnochordales bacterium]
MKQGIHPTMYRTTVTCACGNRFETMSTKKEIRVEICSSCHPFYTGEKQRLVDTTGRVERFQRKWAKTDQV